MGRRQANELRTELNRTRLDQLFTELDHELARAGQSAELYIAGGARMMYGLNPARRTTDVDTMIRQGNEAVKSAADKLQKKHGLAENWLNDSIAGLLPTASDPDAQPVFEGTHLTVHGASPRRMLALKVASLRDRDWEDIWRLMAATGAMNFDKVEELVRHEFRHDGTGAEALLELRLPTFKTELARRTEDPPKAPPPAADAANRQDRNKTPSRGW